MSNLMKSCPHVPPSAYTEAIENASIKIIDILKEHAAVHHGICTGVVEDVLDQVFVYHLKMVADQTCKEKAIAFLRQVLTKIDYHGQYVLKNYL